MKAFNLPTAAFVAILPAFCALADLEVLWWAVPADGTSIDGQDVTVQINRSGTTYDLAGLMATYNISTYDEESGTGGLWARVKVVDASGSATYLAQNIPDSATGVPTISFDIEGVNVDTMPVPNYGNGTGNGWYVADVSEFTDSQYSFYIELGNWEGDSYDTWTSYAETTAGVSYNYLQSSGNIQTWVSSPMLNAGHVWMPMSYVVPEPTSSLLILLGAAGLALRRRRNFSRG